MAGTAEHSQTLMRDLFDLDTAETATVYCFCCDGNGLRRGRLQSPEGLAEIAQLVEHATENRGVGSSILPLGTCGSGSVVEHLLAKERVAGSNPVFRSM